jgi:hypothetical protein
MEVLGILRINIHDLRVLLTVSNATTTANIVNVVVIRVIWRTLEGIETTIRSGTVRPCHLLIV